MIRPRRRPLVILILTLVILFLVLIAAVIIGYLRYRAWEESVREQELRIESLAETEAQYPVELPHWIEHRLIKINGRGRTGDKLVALNDIVIHYVGNPGTSAEQNHEYYNQPDTPVSSHFIVGIEGEVIQCLPLDERSQASNERNRDTISIEVCHPDDTGQFTDATNDSLIRLCAWLLDTSGLDESHIIRHYDITGKECPRYHVRNEDAWYALLDDIRTLREGN